MKYQELKTLIFCLKKINRRVEEDIGRKESCYGGENNRKRIFNEVYTCQNQAKKFSFFEILALGKKYRVVLTTFKVIVRSLMRLSNLSKALETELKKFKIAYYNHAFEKVHPAFSVSFYLFIIVSLQDGI